MKEDVDAKSKKESGDEESCEEKSGSEEKSCQEGREEGPLRRKNQRR